MDAVAIVIAFGVLGVLGLVFGGVLTFADKKFSVKIDERVEKVREAVAGANCGACGYAGCDAFAQAVVDGTANPNACTPGGAKTAEAIGEIMGVKIEAAEPMVAKVICQGTNAVSKERYEYNGYKSCRVAASMSGGPKLCRFSCLGLGDCQEACPFDAISMKDGIAQIDPNKCRACGVCVATCPRNAIEMRLLHDKSLVYCRNTDSGRVARSVCSKACIGCKRCQKECKYDAITVDNDCAKIDPEKCTRCGECSKVCPAGCIIME